MSGRASSRRVVPTPPGFEFAAPKADALATAPRAWFEYRPPAAPILVKNPGVDPIRAVLFPRWLSTTHLIGILKPYAHPSGHFEVVLPAADRKARQLKGTVTSCAYADAMLHAVLLAFGEPVDPREICGPDARPTRGAIPKPAPAPTTTPTTTPTGAPGPASKSGAPSAAEPKATRPVDRAPGALAEPTSGGGAGPTSASDGPPRLLVAIADDEDWRAAERVIRKTHLEPVRVDTLHQACDLLKQEPFEAVLADGAFEGTRLPGVLARLSLTDFTGPVLILDFDTRSEKDRKLPPHRVICLPLTSPEQITDALNTAANAPTLPTG